MRLPSFVAVVALSASACDLPVSFTRADPVDAVKAQVMLCGFPAAQLDLSQLGPPSYGTRIGRVRLGQRLTLHLTGDLNRIKSVEWGVTTPDWASQPPLLRFTPLSPFAADLEGLAVGGDYAVGNWAWAGASMQFKDGSDAGAIVAFCDAQDWQPANHIVVDP